MGNAITYCAPQQNMNKNKNEVQFREDGSFQKLKSGIDKIKNISKLNHDFQLSDNKSESLNRNRNKVFTF
jgi:hypothetical protein